MKTIRDAVHGDIQFSPMEIELMDTLEFQRLRGIKQLGTSFLIYPSAVHTRFEHSLGTCWLSKLMLNHLRKNMGDPSFLQNEEDILYISSLLHDITHIPFGHTFEDERRIYPRHDESTFRIEYLVLNSEVGKKLKAWGLLDAVLDVITKRKTKDSNLKLIKEMVTGTICCDLLDYLKRDAYFCGLQLGYDQRLYNYLSVEDHELKFKLYHQKRFRPDALSELVHLLRIRYTLTERVYYHHAKVASGAMISKALEIALKNELLAHEDLINLKDDAFLYLLRMKGQGCQRLKLILDDLESHQLYCSVFELQARGFEKKGLTEKQKLKLVDKFHYNAKQERQQLEKALANSCGVDESDVIVYCPSDKMALKEADISVLTSENESFVLKEQQYPEVNMLVQKHRSLWKLRVLMSRRCSSKFEKMNQICKDYFCI